MLVNKGANYLDVSTPKSFGNNFYEIFRFLISNGANIDYGNVYDPSPIQRAFKNLNYYSIIWLLFNGVFINPRIQRECVGSIVCLDENEIAKVELLKQKYLELFDHYSGGTLWNVNRNKFFPLSFKLILFSFLVSVFVFSRDSLKKKVPKPLLFCIIQSYVNLKIVSNQKKMRKRKNI